MNNTFAPKLDIFKKIFERIEAGKEDSDTEYFLTLLYTGELLTKLVSLGILSGIQEDSGRSKYTQMYHLVRADGIGDWARIIDELVTGPTSHLATLEMKKVSKELVQKFSKHSWQHDCVALIHSCLVDIGEQMEDLPVKVQAKNWFQYFARLRNKTRGHGATRSQVHNQIAPRLEKSLRLIISNFPLFDYEWAFLFQNISGKYRVSSISSTSNCFNYLKSNDGKKEHYDSGVYIYLNRPVKVELLESDADLSDYFLPNGNFTSKRFEILSYITGDKDTKENTKYLQPAGNLPASETEGSRALDVVGNCFTNLPNFQSLYINRPDLEKQLHNILTDNRHPVITLVGRGGIGKTSLALYVLHELCKSDNFQTILWFSARDIDLLEEGAKSVKPDVIKIDDLAVAFSNLVQPSGYDEKGFNHKEFTQQQLVECKIGPLLVVLDNFETVENPEEMFTWLDTYVRLPNKILITSRFRDFKADYPISVAGLKREEFDSLVYRSSNYLSIADLLTDEFREELYYETGGHPYVTKILLGEVAKEGKLGEIKRIVSENDDLLVALFERTFAIISPAAKRLFLTLCGWRSIVPAIGVEAILQARITEKFDGEEALDELYSFSFIDRIRSKADNLDFVFVPLSAFLFGKKKLRVSPLKSVIDQDLQLLMLFGVGKKGNVNEGVRPRIESFFRQIANNLNSAPLLKLENVEPILRNICIKHYPSWLSLALFFEERDMVDRTIECYQNYLEFEIDDYRKIAIWKKLAGLYLKQGRAFEEANAILRMAEIPFVSFSLISTSAGRINQIVSDGSLHNVEEKMAILDKMIEIFEDRRRNGYTVDSDDLSKLTWLYIHYGNIKEAKKIVKIVLEKEPNHQHCLKIARKLSMSEF
jgi:tetratricopeptide (TPR) repeat protein